MPTAPPVLQGPPCRRCGVALRVVVDGDMLAARCSQCRFAKVFAPSTSPWAALAQASRTAA